MTLFHLAAPLTKKKKESERSVGSQSVPQQWRDFFHASKPCKIHDISTSKQTNKKELKEGKKKRVYPIFQKVWRKNSVWAKDMAFLRAALITVYSV